MNTSSSSNNTLANAVRNQPKEGIGKNFGAFVIPKICQTYTRILKNKCN